MGKRLSLLNRFGRVVRNAFLIVIATLVLWTFITGSEIRIAYNVKTEQKAEVKKVKKTIWQKVLKGLDYAKQVRQVWPM